MSHLHQANRRDSAGSGLPAYQLAAGAETPVARPAHTGVIGVHDAEIHQRPPAVTNGRQLLIAAKAAAEPGGENDEADSLWQTHLASVDTVLLS